MCRISENSYYCISKCTLRKGEIGPSKFLRLQYFVRHKLFVHRQTKRLQPLCSTRSCRAIRRHTPGHGTCETPYLVTMTTSDQHLFPRQKVLLQQSHRANSNRNNGSRSTFAGDATSFRRSDSDRSMSVGSSMRSIKSNMTSISRPKVKKNFVQKVRTSARCLLKNKTVRFATGKHLTDLRFIETIDEYTADDLKILCFSSKNLDDFKGEAEDSASMWAAQPAMAARSAHENPFRGLEDKTPDGQWEAFKARRDVLNAVLDVQDEQMAQSQVPDPQILAHTSVKSTEGSLPAALERAKNDKEEAREHCQKERDGLHSFKQIIGSEARKKTASKESKSKSADRSKKSSETDYPQTIHQESTQIATQKCRRKSMTTNQAIKDAGLSFPPNSSRKTTDIEFSPHSPGKISDNAFTAHSPRKTADITFTPDSPKTNITGKTVSTPKSPRKSSSGKAASTPKSARKAISEKTNASVEISQSKPTLLPETPLCNTNEPKTHGKQPRRNSLVAERAAMFGGSITRGTMASGQKKGTEKGSRSRRASLSVISNTPATSSLDNSASFSPKKPVQRRASTTAMSYLQKGSLDIQSATSCTESSSSSSSIDDQSTVETKNKIKSKNKKTSSKGGKSKTSPKSSNSRAKVGEQLGK